MLKRKTVLYLLRNQDLIALSPRKGISPKGREEDITTLSLEGEIVVDQRGEYKVFQEKKKMNTKERTQAICLGSSCKSYKSYIAQL